MATVREQISIDAGGRAVWNALTTAEGISAWWAHAVRVDARDGGRIVLLRDEDGVQIEERGSFLRVQPTRVIEIVWDGGAEADIKGTRVRFQVGRAGEETAIHVVQSAGPLASDEALCATLDARWKAALHRLREHLES